jgi:hypothetical protein
LLKGALIEFSERFIGPIPNVIVFQYNPSSLTRTLEVWQPPSGGGPESEASATAQPDDPPESFDLTLELDATDALETPDSHPVAVISGVADRVAALEMLLYPQEESLLGGLLGSVTSSLGISGGAGAAPVPRGTVPVVLFVWGPGRIAPVRLTSFSVEEQAFSPTLYPIRASVTVGLKMLTDDDFPQSDSLSEQLAIFAYKYTRKQKQALAALNTANSVESILGMLPF